MSEYQEVDMEELEGMEERGESGDDVFRLEINAADGPSFRRMLTESKELIISLVAQTERGSVFLRARDRNESTTNIDVDPELKSVLDQRRCVIENLCRQREVCLDFIVKWANSDKIKCWERHMEKIDRRIDRLLGLEESGDDE